MTARKWTEADDGTVIRVLGKHQTMAPALAELSEIFGHKITRDSINHRLRSQGLGSAHDNLDRSIPTSIRAVPKTPIVADELERVLFIPDAHIPHEDKAAFDLMLEAARFFKPHSIVCLGDFGDFYQISDHQKGVSDAPSMIEELHAMNRRLDQIDELGATLKKFTKGNHEHRWDRHLAANAPEFAGLCDLDRHLRFRERGWEVVDFLEFARIGKLYVSHCLNSRTFGKNAHRSAQAKFASNVALGHTHRMVSEYVGSVTGESWNTVSFGWLGDRDSLVMKYSSKADRYTDWQLGFGVGWMEPSGILHTQPIPIINSGGRLTCVVNGRLFSSDSAARSEAA